MRDTASRTFAQIAKEWSLFHKQLIDGDASNIFIKRLFKALDDSKKELQVAASDALNEVQCLLHKSCVKLCSQMSPWTDALSKDLIKDCLRYLKNPSFLAKAHLLQAMASIDPDTDQPRGIIKVQFFYADF